MPIQLPGEVSNPSFRDKFRNAWRQFKRVWEYVRSEFARSRGFFFFFCVVLNVLYAFIMVLWHFAKIHKKQVFVVFVALATITAFGILVSKLVFSNPLAAISVVLIGFACMLIYLNKDKLRFKAKESGNGKKTETKKRKRVSKKSLAQLFACLVLSLIVIVLTWEWFSVKGAVAVIVALVVGFVITLIIGYYKKNRAGFSFWDSKVPIVILIGLGIAILNWLLWTLAPATWEFVWNDQKRFWSINMGVFTAICLLLVPKKDKDGKRVDGVNPIANGLSVVIMCLSILVVLSMTWKANWGNRESKLSSAVQAMPTTVPLEVARRVVCECESGCRQFEDDGKTPFMNRGIPDKGVPPSTAFGKYQFLESHRKKAEGLGFDLNTEKGQDEYFDYLYAKEGFGPWLHDEEYGGGIVCLAPKLADYGFQGGKKRVLTVEAPVGKWGELKKLDPKLGKASFFGGGKKYAILWNGTVEENLPHEAGAPSLTPTVTYFFQAKSREDEPLKITVVVGN